MMLPKLAPAAGLALAAALVAPAPAGAATSIFDDARMESGSRSDLRWVRVENSRAEDHFAVRMRLDEVVLGVGLTVWVDRNRSNQGPELRMAADPDSEWALYRVGRFGQRGERIDICGRVRYSQDGRPVARWVTTRSCLGITGAVRVAVRINDPGHGSDWGPERFTFYPWVSARY